MVALTSIHFVPYEYGLDLVALLLFSLGSFLVISILVFYYNRIPKSNQPKSKFQNPIYQSKDILLQQNSINGNYLMAEKTSSTWVKAIIYIFIAIIIFTPFYELIGVAYFV